jgi:hypothetical protein
LQLGLHVQASNPPLLEDAERRAKNHATGEAVKAKKDREMEKKRKRLLKQSSDHDEDDEDDDETWRWPSDGIVPRSMKRRRQLVPSRPQTRMT